MERWVRRRLAWLFASDIPRYRDFQSDGGSLKIDGLTFDSRYEYTFGFLSSYIEWYYISKHINKTLYILFSIATAAALLITALPTEVIAEYRPFFAAAISVFGSVGFNNFRVFRAREDALIKLEHKFQEYLTWCYPRPFNGDEWGKRQSDIAEWIDNLDDGQAAQYFSAHDPRGNSHPHS